MRAYSDVYLGDVVENQGKLFDYVANTYPDKDTEDFINAYMTSKTRQSIDQAKAYVNTMDAEIRLCTSDRGTCRKRGSASQMETACSESRKR